jgi:hypothetical protein
LLIERELGASVKLSRLLWDEVCLHHHIPEIVFSPWRTGVRFHNAQSLLLFEKVSPVVLLDYVERLLAQGQLRRSEVIAFEERLLASTNAYGEWK